MYMYTHSCMCAQARTARGVCAGCCQHKPQAPAPEHHGGAPTHRDDAVIAAHHAACAQGWHGALWPHHGPQSPASPCASRSTHGTKLHSLMAASVTSPDTAMPHNHTARLRCLAGRRPEPLKHRARVLDQCVGVWYVSVMCVYGRFDYSLFVDTNHFFIVNGSYPNMFFLCS